MARERVSTGGNRAPCLPRRRNLLLPAVSDILARTSVMRTYLVARRKECKSANPAWFLASNTPATFALGVGAYSRCNGGWWHKSKSRTAGPSTAFGRKIGQTSLRMTGQLWCDFSYRTLAAKYRNIVGQLNHSPRGFLCFRRGPGGPLRWFSPSCL